DALVAIRGHDVTLRHFLLHDFVVGNIRRRSIAIGDERGLVMLIREGRTTAINIIAIDRAIVMMPLLVLVLYSLPQLFEIPAEWFVPENRLEQNRRQPMV